MIPRPGLRRLRLCAACRSESVYPEARCRRVDARWWRATRVSWWMRLRCGACGARREVIVGERLMERFHAALERRERLRMAADVEVFVLGLELGLIDAGDFAPH